MTNPSISQIAGRFQDLRIGCDYAEDSADLQDIVNEVVGLGANGLAQRMGNMELETGFQLVIRKHFENCFQSEQVKDGIEKVMTLLGV